MNTIFSRIRTSYHSLSEPQKGVADYILNHPEDLVRNTLNETAKASSVSEPTVLRFLRKIDYTSYQMFRIELARELTGDEPETNYDDVRFGDSLEAVMDKVIQATARSVLDSTAVITLESLEKAIEHILRADRILIAGVGASGAIAADFFHKVVKLGFFCAFATDPHLMNIQAAALGENDLIIAISHSGESREILDLVQNPAPKVIALTSYSQSSLARRSAVVLCSSSYETKLRSDAMTSRILQLLIIDILYVAILAKLGPEGLEKVHRSRLAVAKNKT